MGGYLFSFISICYSLRSIKKILHQFPLSYVNKPIEELSYLFMKATTPPTCTCTIVVHNQSSSCMWNYLLLYHSLFEHSSKHNQALSSRYLHRHKKRVFSESVANSNIHDSACTPSQKNAIAVRSGSGNKELYIIQSGVHKTLKAVAVLAALCVFIRLCLIKKQHGPACFNPVEPRVDQLTEPASRA